MSLAASNVGTGKRWSLAANWMDRAIRVTESDRVPSQSKMSSLDLIDFLKRTEGLAASQPLHQPSPQKEDA